jgi:hypothetical protein
MDIKDAVIHRLTGFGLDEDTLDDWLIDFLIDKVSNDIKDDINCEEVPTGLQAVEVDMVCGEYLQSNQVSISDDTAGDIVKRISEGDTTVEFATDTSLSSVTDYLLNHGRAQFEHYRRLTW